MATNYATGTITTTTSDQVIGGSSLISAGTYVLVLGCNALANGDEIQVSVYEKAVTGDTEMLFKAWTIQGILTAATNGEKVFQTPPILSPFSCSFKVKRTLGTDRALTYSIIGP